MTKFQFQSISSIPSFVEAFFAASPRSGQLLKRRDLYLRDVQCIAMSPPCRSYSLHNRGTCLPRDFRLSWCCWRNYILEAEQCQPFVDWGALALLFNRHHHSGVEAVVHAVFEVPLLQFFRSWPLILFVKTRDSNSHVRRQKTHPVEVFWIKLQSVFVVLKLILELIDKNFPSWNWYQNWLTKISLPRIHMKFVWLMTQ